MAVCREAVGRVASWRITSIATPESSLLAEEERRLPSQPATIQERSIPELPGMQIDMPREPGIRCSGCALCICR